MEKRIEKGQTEDVQRATALVDAHLEQSASDLLHAAVVQRLGLRHIISSDAGFDRLPKLERLDPAQSAVWQKPVVYGDEFDLPD